MQVGYFIGIFFGIKLFITYFCFAGDLYDEQQILNWLLTQKDPSGEVIEALEGDDLMNMIKNSESLAVYFCKFHSNYLRKNIKLTTRFHI